MFSKSDAEEINNRSKLLPCRAHGTPVYNKADTAPALQGFTESGRNKHPTKT